MTDHPNGVLIVGEAAADGTLRPVSYELVSAGRAVAAGLGGPVTALLLGSGIDAAARDLAATGVDRLLVVDDPLLTGLPAEAATTAVAHAVQATGAAAVLVPGTTAGRDYAPRLAARLGVGLAADVTDLAVEDGVLVATRPVYGGRIQSAVRLLAAPAMATIRAGSFPKAETTGSGPEPEPLPVQFAAADQRVAVVETTPKTTGPANLELADVVVAGGRGLKEPANFKLVEELAELLGGAVGATRAVVDAGWRPHHEQIGQTGRTVSPRLYLAVGVSGAVQHNVGMQGSDYVVAINRDADAPIFKIAAFGIVGDLFEVVPALAAELRTAKGTP